MFLWQWMFPSNWIKVVAANWHVDEHENFVLDFVTLDVGR